MNHTQSIYNIKILFLFRSEWRNCSESRKLWDSTEAVLRPRRCQHLSSNLYSRIRFETIRVFRSTWLWTLVILVLQFTAESQDGILLWTACADLWPLTYMVSNLIGKSTTSQSKNINDGTKRLPVNEQSKQKPSVSGDNERPPGGGADVSASWIALWSTLAPQSVSPLICPL